MRSKILIQTRQRSSPPRLYALVFTGKISVLTVLFLFLSFFIQPFHQAFANEAEATDDPTPTLPAEVEEQLPDSGSVKVVKNEETEEVEEAVKESTSKTPAETDVTAVSESDEPKEISTDTTSEKAQIVTDEKQDDYVVSDIDDDKGSSTSEIEQEIHTTESPTSTNQTDTDSNEEDGTSTTTDQTESIPGDTSTSTDQADDIVSDNNSTSSDPASGGGSQNNDEPSATSTATSTDEQSGTSTDNSVEVNDASNDSDTIDTTNDNSSTENDESNSGSDGEDNSQEKSSTTDDLINNAGIDEGVNNLVNEVVSDVVNLTRQLVTEENYFQFSKQSCVAVGDGTYHCTTKEKLQLDPESGIYAQQDESGDMEIYMQTSKGDIKQLSDNDYDDTSPDIDLASMRAVWQRMIDGRYQIISYDLEKRVETQLTFSRNNSMEPKVSKEGIVWQAWDGNDWEVMFFDGQFTDQITDNDLQDVTPVVEDGYVLWNVLGGSESEARVYSLESGEVLTITGHEGGTVANPRFVLVYDTNFDNGDVVTQTFDPGTGLAEPITSKPAEMPFDIPEPDPVGEIRALIQNKSNQKDKDVVTVQVADQDGELNLASTTATSSDTLQISTPDLDEADMGTTTEEAVFELEEYDLVITDEASSTDSVINEIYHPGTTTINSATSTQE